jgi:hypothetical protein
VVRGRSGQRVPPSDEHGAPGDDDRASAGHDDRASAGHDDRADRDGHGARD